jgi:hypothetical protein
MVVVMFVVKMNREGLAQSRICMCGKGALPNQARQQRSLTTSISATASSSSYKLQSTPILTSNKPNNPYRLSQTHLQSIYIPTASLSLYQSTYIPTNSLKMVILSTTEIIAKANNAYKEAKQKMLKGKTYAIIRRAKHDTWEEG